MKKVLVLGASGSIGASTIDVIRKHNSFFTLVGASCHKNNELLAKLGKEFNTTELALSSAQTSSQFKYCGAEGILSLIRECDADIVLNGIAGSAGLLPSITAVQKGVDLALANKETIVMAGELIQSLAKESF